MKHFQHTLSLRFLITSFAILLLGNFMLLSQQHVVFAPSIAAVDISEISDDRSDICQIFDSREVDNSLSDEFAQPILTTNTMNLDSLVNVEDTFDISLEPISASEHFSWKQMIAPGILLGAGLLGAIDETNGVNKAVRDCMSDWRGSHKTHVDDYLRFLPSAAYLGLGFIPGVMARHNTRDRLLVAATSHASMLLLGYGFKFMIKERRPDMTDRKSFPSGHVSLAFTGAELTRIEYGTAYGIAAYTTASAVAFLRLYNERHWLHDVVMGAGIGILSARIGYWLLPLEHRLLKINDKPDKPLVAALPAYDPYHQSFGMSVVAQF